MNSTNSTFFRRIAREEQKWVNEAEAAHEAEDEEFFSLLEAELKRLEDELGEGVSLAEVDEVLKGEDSI
jgi:hypothetical protein